MTEASRISSTTRPVTTVITTYQSAPLVSTMLAGARRCAQAGLTEVVIVDNDSSDGTGDLLTREAGDFRVILSGRNNGFGRGCNLGMPYVDTRYTLFLNPDASIEPDAIRTMVDFLDANPHVGIVGPATLCGERIGQAGAEPIYQKTGPLPTPWSLLAETLPGFRSRVQTLRPIVPGSAPFRTGWICGAIFMIRTDLLKQLQGFDPRFFLYWEETDLCRRAENLGMQSWALGTALGRHIGGASSSEDDTRVAGCIAKHYYQSRRYYMAKHHGELTTTFCELVEFVYLSLQTSWDVLRGRGTGRMKLRLQAALFSEPDAVA